MKNLYCIYAFLLLLLSCKNGEVTPATPFGNGIIVTNEGNYGKGTGSLSYLNRTPNSSAELNIFEKANPGRTLGDVVQSYHIHNQFGYIVVNNSNKIEVVDAGTMKAVGSIEQGVDQVRYFTARNQKGYATCWGSSSASVAVIDLSTRKVIKNIAVNAGPEGMYMSGNELFIAISGGFGTNNEVVVIDTDTDQIKSKITVGDAPMGFVKDANNKLWILCRGRYGAFSNPNDLGSISKLMRLNITSKQIEISFEIGLPSKAKASSLSISPDGKNLYFTYNGGVHRFAIDDASIPANVPIIRKSFYGFGVDNATGQLYGADALDFNQAGLVFRYRPDGTKIDSVRVGVIPNGFFFQ